MPIIQAFAEGKAIEFRDKPGARKNIINVSNDWIETETIVFWNDVEYRIKPESKYRPFKDTEECWTEMQKHQPFGWVKDKKDEHHRVLITAVGDGTYEISLNGNSAWSLSGIMDLFTFADGIPFGVKEEE